MLAARVPPFAASSVGTGTSRPEIDSSHAAALCAGMEQHAYQAGLARACCPSAINWVRFALQMKAMELSQKEWISDKFWPKYAAIISKNNDGRPASIVMADMVIAYLIRPSEWETGRRIEQAGVSQFIWDKHVKHRYNQVGAQLDAWLAEADRHIYAAQQE